MDATLSRTFDEIDAAMLGEVGGKAANLGEMTRAGFPVPPGWCLTTEAYRRAADGAGLDQVIAELAQTRPADVAALGALAARARELLLKAPIPPEVRAEVLERHTGGPVAVRSSATAEDLPYASFAGQQETYLNVVGEEAVLEAVRRCWASLWTDRAVAYRAANGIDHGSVRLAVVVQEMVDAEVAGVMFTANPVTGRRREAVIDAGPGLGEAVVSGAVNPDRFVVDVATGEILERRAGDKRLAVRPAAGGGTREVTGGTDGLCLTDEQARELARLGARVEDHYGAPQDTEWAIDAAGRVWLVQARPITTLYPLPEPRAPGLRAYFSVNVAQGVFAPITPMGLSAFRLISAGAAEMLGFPVADRHQGAPVAAFAGQRMWLDITPAVRSRPGRAILPRLLAVGEARTVAVVERLTRDERLSVTQPSWRPFLRRMARFAWRVHLPRRVPLALAAPDAALAVARRVEEDLRARLRVPPGATPAQRVDHAERVLYGVPPLIASIMPMALAGYGMLGLAARLSGTSLGELQDVLRSLPNNPTTEMDLELWRLSRRIEPLGEEPAEELVRRFRAGELPPRAQEEITKFLDKYGHRGIAEIDLGVPRWSDDPSHILGVLAAYQRMGEGAAAPDELFARGAQDAARAVARAAAKAGPLKAPLVRFALRRTRKLAGLREVPKFDAVLVLAAVRRSMRVVGEHLVECGVLDSADDVYFLTFPEVRAALDGGDRREPVAERRAAYELERRRRHVPRVLLSDGTEPEALAAVAAEGALTGTPASAGTVTGVARVVLDPVDARLEPGEILVCPSTDPGWTPLFLTAGGLVMEMGGSMSHGAVVAREYGIPAVVGVPHATERIASGQVITVDGATGTVTVAEDEPQPESEGSTSAA
ncbi:PEP/pyruvate-binding domain-containing protein [Thermoactinospora rubra]|uniref:PEP/pyruvate-binding domain-containing protein n=1 Tax=Thermoactinospora rubra TaxID=1088767 RepID=UPI000A10AF14|nr:PEP/pyruvate-binding domain-containing protein [Thermoactinospora rubra]